MKGGGAGAAKYNEEDNYGLILSARIWYTKEELLNINMSEIDKKDRDTKFKKICDKSDDILKDKAVKDKVKSNSFLDNTIKQIRNKSLLLKLTPLIISKLSIINGDFSFTLYNLGDLNPNAQLLSFNHYNSTIYYILENGNVLLKGGAREDHLSEKGIYRSKEEMSIFFKKIDHLALGELHPHKALNKKTEESLLPKVHSTQIELKYNFKRLIEMNRSYLQDLKIGTIDLETYTVDLLGKQEVYAAGWLVNNAQGVEVITYYLDQDNCFSSQKIVQNLFNDIFKSNYHNYTIYIHNLSNFDSVFIIDALTREDCKVKPIIKEDGSLISLKIIKKVNLKGTEFVNNNKTKTRTINVYDSALMLNDSLRNLCKHFECHNIKGYFPYKFINYNTLMYCGQPPVYELFNTTDLSLSDYNKLYPKNYEFSVKFETLRYLKLDLLALYEIMIKFSNIIFEEYGLNITKYKTISGLSLYIYLSNFYDINHNIIKIKGGIKKEIKKAYDISKLLLFLRKRYKFICDLK